MPSCINEPISPETAAEHARRGITACTYYAAHQRLRRARGVARAHSCVDCGGPSAQWSYTPGSSAELTGTIEVYSPDQPVRWADAHWSPDVMDYAPRCEDCHRKADWTDERRVAVASKRAVYADRTANRVTILAMLGVDRADMPDLLGITKSTVRRGLLRAKERSER